MEAKSLRFRVAKVTLRVGQHLRISKEKIKFANVAKHNFSTEKFRIVKLIDTCPQEVYELEDLSGTTIDGKLYQEELTPVRINSRTTYKIDIIQTRGSDEAFQNISSAGEFTIGTLTRGYLHIV
jgi:hypothetical protein